jgi:hypothetical protein
VSLCRLHQDTMQPTTCAHTFQAEEKLVRAAERTRMTGRSIVYNKKVSEEDRESTNLLLADSSSCGLQGARSSTRQQPDPLQGRCPFEMRGGSNITGASPLSRSTTVSGVTPNQCRLNDVIINECPKFLTSKPNDETHSIYFPPQEDVRIPPLSTHGIHSYLLTRKPTSWELDNLEELELLTSNDIEWYPHGQQAILAAGGEYDRRSWTLL